MRSLHDLNFSDVISFDLYFKGLFLRTSKIHVKHSDLLKRVIKRNGNTTIKRAARICQRRTRRLEKTTIHVKQLEDKVDNVEKRIGNIYGLSHYKHITLIGISHR